MIGSAPVAVPLLAAERRQVQQADRLTAAADLNSAQASLEVGQTIPVIFGRRTGGAGGVFVSPAAAECRFENDSVNRVTGSYMLVLCEGQLPAIAATDLYQGDTPLVAGEFSQSYNARAAGWAPGNFIQQRFNVTTDYQEIKLEGKAIGAGGFFDVSGMSVEELADEIGDAIATGTIKSKGDYITSFQVTVAKKINWSISGMYAAQAGPPIFSFAGVSGSGGTGTGGGGSDLSGIPTKAYYESLTWTGAFNDKIPKIIEPRFRFFVNGWVLRFEVGNRWIYDRADQGRYINFSGYSLTRPASTEPYGNIEINVAETIRGGFITAQTAQFLAIDGIYSTGLFGGLVGVTYTLTVIEENSEPYPKPEATLFCGNGGNYSGVTTLSIVKQYPAENEGWKRQIHAFIRECPPIYRLIEASSGPSNLFPDLARYALLASGQINVAQLDDAELLAAAQFCQANNITCDGIASVPTNPLEWLDRLAPLFLLRPTNRWGKIGLRPAVPVIGTAIQTTPLTPVATFDESNIEPGSFTVQGIPAEDRNWRVQLLPLWREQPETNIGIVRGTGPVRFADVPDSASSETIDASEWVTRELHAVRLAALELARRRHIEHLASLRTPATVAVAALRPGDIVRVNRARIPTVGNPSEWVYLYTLLNISGPPLGPWTLDLEHHPVDSTGVSLVAREVAAASIA